MEKESSLMVVIPENPEEIFPNSFMERLTSNEDIKLVSILSEPSDESVLILKVAVKTREYDIAIDLTGNEIPEFFRTSHFFSDLDFEEISSRETALIVDMQFSSDFFQSYHDQLKIINCLVPHKLAVLDVPSEKILSGKWVKLASETDIFPAPRYLFTSQAVSDESGEVWIHTHGLNRCGLPELEILGSDTETYDLHYPVIENIAVRMLENGQEIESYEEEFLAWLTDEVPIVATLVEWEEAIKYYPDIKIGTKEDRDDYHSSNTKAIMVYLTPDDADNHKVSPLNVLNEYMEDNPLYMISTSETNRMKALSQERIQYVKDIFMDSDIEKEIILKIGLEIDEQYKDEDSQNTKEHIWFELKEIKGDKFVCELTQDPYYVDDMKTGSIGEYDLSDITDWIIFTKERRYTPDDVYMINTGK